jgi:hypothetical protein
VDVKAALWIAYCNQKVGRKAKIVLCNKSQTGRQTAISYAQSAKLE